MDLFRGSFTGRLQRLSLVSTTPIRCLVLYRSSEHASGAAECENKIRVPSKAASITWILSVRQACRALAAGDHAILQKTFAITRLKTSKMSKQHVVITSIQKPTPSVQQFAKLLNGQLIVVGDQKTPANWQHPGVHFIGLQAQEKNTYALARHLPYNSYSRKMIGYIYAIRAKAEIIVDTDDDNRPKDNWCVPDFDGSYESVPGEEAYINVYGLFSNQPIWPRGLPLKLITDPQSVPRTLKPAQPCRVGIWQGLADGDPDVDAIYRLSCGKPCFFNTRAPIVLQNGAVSQINSQNTIHRQPFFPLLYLPLTVNFRFTDILRGYIAQPILWLYGYQLGFTQATVVQDRNPHDYKKDFFDEMQMYQSSEDLISIVQPVIKAEKSVAENLRLAYKALCAEGVVQKNELDGLEAWFSDIGAK